MRAGSTSPTSFASGRRQSISSRSSSRIDQARSRPPARALRALRLHPFHACDSPCEPPSSSRPCRSRTSSHVAKPVGTCLAWQVCSCPASSVCGPADLGGGGGASDLGRFRRRFRPRSAARGRRLQRAGTARGSRGSGCPAELTSGTGPRVGAGHSLSVVWRVGLVPRAGGAKSPS